jgi:hypothetical protein
MSVNRTVPSIQQPIANPEALTQVMLQVRQGLQFLSGQLGGPYDRAATLQDLINLGLVKKDAVDQLPDIAPAPAVRR